MEVYLSMFVNWEQNDWARHLPMAEFIYSNVKNAGTGHLLFELNCGYPPEASFQEYPDPRSRSKSAKHLSN